jgi:hypothetical protein
LIIKKGIFTYSHACGIVINVNEMVLSEARFDILDELYRLTLISKKKFVIYDDACHLDETVRKYARYRPFRNIKFFIDKFHLRNHKREICKTKFNQKLNENISHLNSEICEQNFSLMFKHKYMLKHMNKYHYNFFLLCVYNSLNEKISLKIKKKHVLKIFE